MKILFFYPKKTSANKYLLFLFFLTLVLTDISPKTCLADGKSIFDENNGSVVVVYAYDKDGNQINQANGFIVRKDGVVVTNYHFISNATKIKIKLEDTMLDIKGLLHIDRKNDIAMIKTEGNNFPAIKIHDNDIGPEGQAIYLIGSPRDEDKMIFDGTLSRIKSISPEKKLLIITTPVTKNCSGSPVFNKNGEVIGIATFFIEEAQTFYFAMPIAQIKDKLSLKKITPLRKAKLKASEETAEYWFNLATAYESISLWTSASGAYQKAIEIDPQDPLTHNNLGVVYTNLDIYSFAIRELTEAIRLKPDYQEAYVNLGIAYEKSDMPQKAIATFEKAIRLKPDDAKSHNNLAVTFFKAGKFKEAIEAFKKAIIIKPDYPNAYYNMGAVYYKMNMKRDAIEAFQESIRLNPDHAKAHFELGFIYSVHDTVSALQEYEILKNLDPYAADILRKIIETNGNASSEALVLSPEAATEEIQQTETTITSTGEAPPADVPAPEKDGLSPQADETSVKEPVTSGRNDKSENTSIKKKPVQSVRIMKKDIYSVQVSVFDKKKNALSLTKRLKKKGYKVFLITEHRVDQNTRYRVLVGRFAEKALAVKQARILLKKEKLKSIIYKH